RACGDFAVDRAVFGLYYDRVGLRVDPVSLFSLRTHGSESSVTPGLRAVDGAAGVTRVVWLPGEVLTVGVLS
ncbi:MAG: hypothetical protein O2992_15730, partial [Gemmatimonadetes bacterium]|nr:hypothetical protein [Gemmatimonadota bacterium]